MGGQGGYPPHWGGRVCDAAPYVYIYICMYVYIYIYIYVYMYVCICTFAYYITTHMRAACTFFLLDSALRPGSTRLKSGGSSARRV